MGVVGQGGEYQEILGLGSRVYEQKKGILFSHLLGLVKDPNPKFGMLPLTLTVLTRDFKGGTRIPIYN